MEAFFYFGTVFVAGNDLQKPATNKVLNLHLRGSPYIIWCLMTKNGTCSSSHSPGILWYT